MMFHDVRLGIAVIVVSMFLGLIGCVCTIVSVVVEDASLVRIFGGVWLLSVLLLGLGIWFL